MAKEQLLNSAFVQVTIHLLQMTHVLQTLRALSRIPTDRLALMLLQALVADENFAVLAFYRLDWDTFANDALEVG